MKSLGEIQAARKPIKKNKLSERGELIGYFSEQTLRTPMLTSIHLAHYTLDQLYALKTMFKERAETNRTSALKWFWWKTRTTKV